MTALPFKVKAIYDYSSPHDDDLSFPNGQILNVTDEEDADWYYGEYSDANGIKQQGLFPKNFVKRYEPATPPRPSRPARPKKESEHPLVSQLASEPASTEVEHAADVKQDSTSLTASVSKDMTTSPGADRSSPVLKSPPNLAFSIGTSSASIAVKPFQQGSSEPALAPAPIAEKPSSGSFRDRIAAFNKPSAPPVAPAKPGGFSQTTGSAFVKKPYVAPPPSRNAFVSPPREPPSQSVYRKEEESELLGQVSHEAEMNTTSSQPTATESTDAKDEPQHKPTSLKDRIALLQQQQLEQAARHVDTIHKREKPKRPPKRRMESHHTAVSVDHDAEDEEPQSHSIEETARIREGGVQDEKHYQHVRSSTYQGLGSREVTSLVSPTSEYLNDPNHADQSGVGEMENGGDISTGRDDSGEKPSTKISTSTQRPLNSFVWGLDPRPEEGFIEENAGEEEEDEVDEEEDIDPEVRRKMEIRERMAKMSGGMGMAGMFGPPGGMPFLTAKKQKASSSSAKGLLPEQPLGDADLTAVRVQPIIGLPGMQRVRSPEQSEKESEVLKDSDLSFAPVSHGRAFEQVPDLDEDEGEPLRKALKHEERGIPPSFSLDHPTVPPSTQRGVLPPVPSERPAPVKPYYESRPVPPITSNSALTPSLDSDSISESSSHAERLALDTDVSLENRSFGQEARQVPPTMLGLPPRPHIPQSSPLPYDEHDLNLSADSASVTNPETVNMMSSRSSRIPPIPGTGHSLPSPPQTNAPVPTVPKQTIPSRKSTGDSKIHLGAARLQSPGNEEDGAGAEPDREERGKYEDITEYDRDYDTDMTSSTTPKDALKSNDRGSSTDELLTGDEAAYHHEGLPSLGPRPGVPPMPTAPAPRALPPPPPSQPPKQIRQSSEMPRSAPPPLPPKRNSYDEQEGNFGPASYTLSRQQTFTNTGLPYPEDVVVSRVEERNDGLYGSLQVQQHPASPSAAGSTSYMASPTLSSSVPRRSLDMLRSSNARKSTEANRPSVEQGFIADDIDLGRASQWWLQRKMPPPVYQNRTDITFEIEETGATQQGSGQFILKHVYILFMDYSQTVITAHFDTKDPSKVEFQQRHEPPPLAPRQDQLEDAHVKFGSRLAEMANARLNHVIGDGSPFALVIDLLNAFPQALPPVGTRAYGAIVYTNLANASVQQNDEIRAGDIVSFRNAKLQGHRGPMKQKYNVEVGKPDHVAVVVDWDGTKKKIRAWEQGREAKKVKIESFKLGDLRSGEVKVWRVMAREWVGWGGTHI